MPVKKDSSGKRWVEMEVLVPGTPEQVWQAMATGNGNSAWFTPTTVDGRVGGTIRFDFASDGSSVGEITAWDPPRKFGYVERDWMPGAPEVATEITVIARSGGRCVVRMVHSLFASTDDWDDQLEGFEGGWPGFFEVLQVYLTHFAGAPAASFRAVVPYAGDERAAWRLVAQGLGVAGADVGERCESAPGAPPLAGVLERVQQDRKQRYVIVRLDDPMAGVAFGGTYSYAGQVRGSLLIYLYGDGAAPKVAQAEREWDAWLRDALQAPATTT